MLSSISSGLCDDFSMNIFPSLGTKLKGGYISPVEMNDKPDEVVAISSAPVPTKRLWHLNPSK